MRWIGILGSIVLTVGLGYTVCTAAIYTWTDAHGIKRYSNAQPPDDAENVRRIDEIPYDPQNAERIRQEFEQMVEEAGREADRHFEEQAEEKAREEQLEQEEKQAQQDQRIARERAGLEQQIAEIERRGLGPHFTAGMKENLIRQIQEKIERLESDPDAYFKDRTQSY